MLASLEIFKEGGFTSDLTGNFFDIVIFKGYHFGFYYKNKLLHFVIQNPKKTYFFGIWFSKKRAIDYFKSTSESSSYKKHILGKIYERKS